MRFLVLHGPNLNLLGKREITIYGGTPFEELCAMIETHAKEKGHIAVNYQSNHEGDLIDQIQLAEGQYDGIIMNPGAYAHYSYAIHDAIRSVQIPVVEVHITAIEEREEPWRHVSVTAPACRAMISGHGYHGYLEAMDLLIASTV